MPTVYERAEANPSAVLRRGTMPLAALPSGPAMIQTASRLPNQNSIVHPAVYMYKDTFPMWLGTPPSTAVPVKTVQNNNNANNGQQQQNQVRRRTTIASYIPAWMHRRVQAVASRCSKDGVLGLCLECEINFTREWNCI